jgi:hypothetical protein
MGALHRGRRWIAGSSATSFMQMNKNHKSLLFWLVLLVTASVIYYYAQARG